jgi:ABC-type uncharacterized transport system permease subunit
VLTFVLIPEVYIRLFAPDEGSFEGLVTLARTLLGFAAGMAAGAFMAGVFGVLVIWLNTNQYATGLALRLFGGGFSAFAGTSYVQARLPEQTPWAVPVLGDIPFVGFLFRDRSIVDDKRELLIFVTPRVLNDRLSSR